MPLRYVDERAKAGVIQQLTSLTIAEFEMLTPLVQDAFLAHMAEWTLEGKPRGGRQYSQYANCPLPTPEDRLLFVVMDRKDAPLQTAHAAAFGLTQPKANRWLHVRLTALQAALMTSGAMPTRTVTALQERLDAVTSTRAATATTPAPDAATPLCTTARNAPSRAPRTQVIRPTITAARKSGTRSKT